MGSFKNELLLVPIKGYQWKLGEELEYTSDSGVKVTVPKGFLFDGASIPRGLWNILRVGGVQLYGACVHDYCYRTHVVDKKTADDLFLEALLDKGVSEIKANTMYKAVDWFGSGSYKRAGLRGVLEAEALGHLEETEAIRSQGEKQDGLE